MKAIVTALGCLYCSIATAQFFVAKQQEIIQIDKREVSNKDWAAFLQFAKNDPILSKKDRHSITPSGWNTSQLSLNNQHQPVRGITWQQALAYCEWRSTMATYLSSHSRASNYQQMQQANSTAKSYITYRLPTGEELQRVTPTSSNTKAGVAFRCVRSVGKTS